MTGGDQHAAEDVLQETWVRAWQNIDRLVEQHGSVRGWLTRVAHNIAVDQHRGRRARPTEVRFPEHGLDDVAAPSGADEIENRLVVGTLLSELPDPHREALVQVYYADRTASSAACALGVPPGTVKSRVHHGLRKLRASVSARDHEKAGAGSTARLDHGDRHGCPP